jgi:hypothetical protein
MVEVSQAAVLTGIGKMSKEKVTKEELENKALELKEKIWAYMDEKKVKHEPLRSAMNDLLDELEEYQNQIEDST